MKRANLLSNDTEKKLKYNNCPIYPADVCAEVFNYLGSFPSDVFTYEIVTYGKIVDIYLRSILCRDDMLLELAYLTGDQIEDYLNNSRLDWNGNYHVFVSNSSNEEACLHVELY